MYLSINYSSRFLPLSQTIMLYLINSQVLLDKLVLYQDNIFLQVLSSPYHISARFFIFAPGRKTFFIYSVLLINKKWIDWNITKVEKDSKQYLRVGSVMWLSHLMQIFSHYQIHIERIFTVSMFSMHIEFALTYLFDTFNSHSNVHSICIIDHCECNIKWIWCVLMIRKVV